MAQSKAKTTATEINLELSDFMKKYSETPVNEFARSPRPLPTRRNVEQKIGGTSQPDVEEEEHPVIRDGMGVSKHIVSVRDDNEPALTFRSVVLGSLLTVFSSVITMLYMFKPVQVQVSAVFLQLLVWPIGVAWERFTPNPDHYSKEPTLQKVLRFLNCGQKFNIKEHVVASLLATTGNNGAAGSESFAVMRLYYGLTPSTSTVVLTLFSISLIGFVIAGALRPLIVYPAEMVYWTNLPQVVLFQSLHWDVRKNKERLKKFSWALLITGIWEVFPAYIAPWLGGMSLFCLASVSAPLRTRRVFRNVFGGAAANQGAGLFSISLDWQYIQSTYLALPIKQQLNTWIGYIIFYPVVVALYYSNVWNAKNFRFMSAGLFASNGSDYDMTAILSPTGIIDEAKFAAAGPPQLTSTTVWGFFTANLAIGALITHVIIFWGGEMREAWNQVKSGTQPDPHYQAMLRYREVPMWWYALMFFLCFLAGIIVTSRNELTLPWWGFVIALILGAFIAPFSCILYGMYGTGIGTNQLSKMVGGAIHSGRPLANLFFAGWSHQVILLAVNLASWQKMGQYTKVPPKAMFSTQVYGTLLGAFLNYGVMTIIVDSKKDELISGKSDQWSDAYVQSLNTQAITWALARKVYDADGRYILVPLGLLIGLFFPIIHYGIIKLWPSVKILPLNTAVIASMAGTLYYGSTSWVFSTVVTGVVSQIWIRRRMPQIFNRYVYIVGAAMDGGSQIVIFILSFAVFGAGGVSRPFPLWWGNPDGPADHCLPAKA